MRNTIYVLLFVIKFFNVHASHEELKREADHFKSEFSRDYEHADLYMNLHGVFQKIDLDQTNAFGGH